ncbi:ABC transporter ATP-binding protein [Bradyrhizobium sp. SK17]|uniref:ABC transporter ATP-binding protein n=1 Tax=Bradyrhizobium sp. SK17 TaxID=2057741 RepID=UPI000C31AC84|nr:ABC transporter ATP-binding protein [Bradyrhizobium sp. SK17]AUC97708.1 ABC transporter ATP-binding protein [Bradyrhizobium sp. SK17]
MSEPLPRGPVAEIFRAYWKSDRWALLLVATIVFLASASGIAAPYLFSRLIDRLTRETVVADLLWAFLIYAALVGLASALQRVVQNLSVITAENLGFIVSTQFFARILRKRSDFFIEHNAAEIQTAGNQGRGALTTLLQIVLIVFIPAATQVTLTLVTFGALLDNQVVAIVTGYGALVLILTYLSTSRSQMLLDAAVSASQDNARFTGNAMNAMEALRHLGSHAWMSGRFAEKARAVKDSWRAYMLRRALTLALLGLGLSVQFAVSFLLLLPRYQAGTTTVGDIVLFNTLLLQLNLPFEMISQTMDNVARSRAQLVPLARMWQAPEEIETKDAQGFAPRNGRITFDQVDYAYGNGRGIAGISFVAHRGAITFIVGETGSGKSTIFKLALKSVEPDAGRILVDDIDLAQIARADWYGTIAVVPQDVALLNESLADNIILGRGRDDARLREVAEKAAILSFIEALPDGFETTVGERGLKLSGGERQRIAIARALYGRPTVLFLDEASSALDDATERDIMEHVRTLVDDVTVLAITHRRAILADGDNVVDLNATRPVQGEPTVQ